MLPAQQDPADKPTPDQDAAEDENTDDAKQVSAVSGMDAAEGPQVVAPGDATAGYPDSESGMPNEGEAGPNAAPHHDSPRSGASSQDSDRG
jgi:hypothetical protein